MTDKPFADVVAITCSNNRPGLFERCREYMARQTARPRCWIAAGSAYIAGSSPAHNPDLCIIHQTTGSPWLDFCRNMQAALRMADGLNPGTPVIFFEDDDHYANDHVALMADHLGAGHDLVGDAYHRRYHVPSRKWMSKTFKGCAAWAQTGLSAEAAREFAEYLQAGNKVNGHKPFAFDRHFWRDSGLTRKRLLSGLQTHVSIKGLSGDVLGRYGSDEPYGPEWTRDPNGAMLWDWIGDDSGFYLSHGDTAPGESPKKV